jgi:hypothetical protein
MEDRHVNELLSTILGHYQDAAWRKFEAEALSKLTPEQTEALLFKLALKQRQAETEVDVLIIQLIIFVVNAYTKPRG